ncbi:uncharacterized protein LOC131858918 [Cryptomeria japonica]|uniref:uncharacterized protein LOC131858918 n=1 Tax=Cryptomeria japonica TaxID=3369 RepID=UPI0027D9FF83|nr:uncharacterized protein LOC131858918 [Cryptomeria japonica]
MAFGDEDELSDDSLELSVEVGETNTRTIKQTKSKPNKAAKGSMRGRKNRQKLLEEADKCQLWEEITKTLEEIKPTITIVAGDFNATLSHSDKRGGVRRMCRIQTDFQTCVDSNALFEVDAKGGNFTWNNRHLGFSNIVEKLDRFFLVGEWNLAPLVCEAEVLAISGSDHFPNRTVFENIFEEKRKIEGELGALNLKVLAKGMDEVDYLIEKDMVKRSLNRILSLLVKDGTSTNDSDRINQEVVDFFGNLWNKSRIDQVRLKDEFLAVIPQLVTREDNQMVEEPISLKELKAVVFGLGGENASGSDDFQDFFY